MRLDSKWNTTFSTNREQADQFLQQVRTCLNPEELDRPMHVLEVGCGDGGQLARLAELLPQARLMGVDISEPNIRAAESRPVAESVRQRLDFILGDYRDMTLARYDLIISDTTLHLIPGSNDELFSKLASELKPDGRLVFTIPYRCLFNAMLSTMRRTLRLFRSRLTDRLILALAAKVHGNAHSREFLRERLHYMYILPCRYGSHSFAKALQSRHDLVAERALECAHSSLGKPKHRFYSFRLDRVS
jgi:trans-aconitate methyltransferase